MVWSQLVLLVAMCDVGGSCELVMEGVRSSSCISDIALRVL